VWDVLHRQLSPRATEVATSNLAFYWNIGRRNAARSGATSGRFYRNFAMPKLFTTGPANISAWTFSSFPRFIVTAATTIGCPGGFPFALVRSAAPSSTRRRDALLKPRFSGPTGALSENPR
jgi:hypothetical protein